MAYLDDIETSLAQLLPVTWDESALTRIFGPARFTRDEAALHDTLLEPLRDFVFRGGKRLRPVLFLTLVDGLGGKAANHLEIARLIELAHNATLIIDDVEDASKLRRGKPTLHEGFGLDVAVNAGVALHLLPLQVLGEQFAALKGAQQARLYAVYHDVLTHLYAGQATDIFWHRTLPRDVTPDKYLEMCRLKTGSLMRMAARFACIVTGQDSHTEDVLAAFAESAGVAFQIKDDVLDLTGDGQKTQKAVGGDITEGKISLPLILALPQMSTEQQDRLWSILALRTRDQVVIDEARHLIIGTDAPALALKRAAALVQDALSRIDETPLSATGKSSLRDLAEEFVARDH